MYMQCVNVLCNVDVDGIVKRNCQLRENPLLWPGRPKLLRLGLGAGLSLQTLTCVLSLSQAFVYRLVGSVQVV